MILDDDDNFPRTSKIILRMNEAILEKPSKNTSSESISSPQIPDRRNMFWMIDLVFCNVFYISSNSTNLSISIESTVENQPNNRM